MPTPRNRISLLIAVAALATVGHCPPTAAAQCPGQTNSITPPAAFKPVSFPALNFQWTALEPGWKFDDHVDPFMRTLVVLEAPDGATNVVIKAYLVGAERQRTPDRLASDTIADGLGLGITITETARTPLVLASVEGVLVTGSVKMADGGTQRFDGWFASYAGREYVFTQLSRSDAATATATAKRALGGFARLNANSNVHLADLAPIRPVSSPLFRYVLRLPGGWQVIPTPPDSFQNAEAGAYFAEHSMVEYVPALLIDGLRSDDVAADVFNTHGFNAAVPNVHRTPSTMSGRLTVYDATRIDAATTTRPAIHHKARLWVGDGTALFAVASSWHEQADAINEEALSHTDVSQLADNADAGFPAKRMTPEAILSADRKSRPPTGLRGAIAASVAQDRFRHADYHAAAELAELSLQEQLDPSIAALWIESLTRDGQLASGRDLAVLVVQRFPREPAVVQALVNLTARANDVKVTRALGDAAFAAGVTNDDLFTTYLDVLIAANDLPGADAQLTAYKRRSDTGAIARLEAQLRLAQNRPADAARVMQAKLDAGRATLDEVGLMLSRALVEDGQVDAAAALNERLAHAKVPPYLLSIARGRVLMAQNDYAAAKREFETANTQRPDDPQVAKWIQTASAHSEQGKNASLRNAIESVALPASVPANAAAPATPLDHGMGAAYRRSVTAIRLDATKPTRVTQDEVVEIYDDRGVEMFNALTLTLNPLDERIFINKVEVTDLDGNRISQGNPDDYYVLDAASDEIATMKQTINVPVKGLRAGSLLHVVSTRERLAAEDEVRFDEAFACHTLPTGESILCVTGDTSNLATFEFNGVKRDASTPGDEGALVWRVESPPCLASEPLLARTSEIAPGVALGDRRTTWTNQGLRYLHDISVRLPAGNAAIAREVASLNLPADAAPLDKLRAVARHVQHDYVYKAIAFGPKAWMPTDPTQICTNRYGDCKDQALLVHLMLQAVGVQSNLALVRAEGPVYPTIASSNQFDHMIVRVPAQADGAIDDCWIDTTDRDGDAVQPTPSPGLYGRHALVLDPKGPTLEALPAWDPVKGGGMRVDRAVTLGEDGAFGVVDHTTFRGWMAGMARRTLRNADENRRGEYAARLLGLDLSDVKSWSVKFIGLDDVTAPVVIDASYVPRQKLKKTGTRLVGELPSACEKSFLAPTVVQSRRLPFEMLWGINYEVKLDLRWPAAWEAEVPADAAPTSLASSFQDASVGFAEVGTEHNHRTGTLSVHSRPGLFAANRYGDYCDTRQAIVDAWAVPLVFRTDAHQ